jgi:hypothetical protein
VPVDAFVNRYRGNRNLRHVKYTKNLHNKGFGCGVTGLLGIVVELKRKCVSIISSDYGYSS